MPDNLIIAPARVGETAFVAYSADAWRYAKTLRRCGRIATVPTMLAAKAEREWRADATDCGRSGKACRARDEPTPCKRVRRMP